MAEQIRFRSGNRTGVRKTGFEVVSIRRQLFGFIVNQSLLSGA